MMMSITPESGKKSLQNLWKSPAWLLLPFFLVSCASISVKDEQLLSEAEPRQKPDRIFVTDFTFEGTDLNVDRDGQELIGFKKNLQKMMSASLVERLSKHIAPATAVEFVRPNASMGNYWVVAGNFTRVNQGSRALRTAIGFGAGGTKMEADIRVYNRNANTLPPFLNFQTTGGSNAEPGAVTGLGPGSILVTGASIAATGGSVIMHGITEDTIRSSRMITATLSDYLHRHGWETLEDPIAPKRQKPQD